MDFNVPAKATHARIVLTPLWDVNTSASERVCHWYDTYKYSSKLTVKVFKDQSPVENLLDSLYLTQANYKRSSGSDTKMTDDTVYTEGYTTTEEAVCVLDYEFFDVVIPGNGGSVEILFYNNDGKFVTSKSSTNNSIVPKNWRESVPSNAAYAHINFVECDGVYRNTYEFYFF